MEFEILLALQVALEKIEKETNFRFVIDKNNAEIYCFEPNSKESFDKINIQKELKESENGNPIKRPDSTSVERCSSNIIRRVRGIIGKKIAESRKLESANRNLQEFSTYGNGYPHIRASLSQRQKQLEEEIRQSQTYKQKALESYQQQLGASAPQSNSQRESSQLIDYESLLNTDKGFRTKETLESLIKDIAKEYKIDIEEARKGIEKELQKEAQQNHSKTSLIDSKQSKQEIKSQSKAIPKESKKEIPKPISKTKSTKQTKEPYRGR